MKRLLILFIVTFLSLPIFAQNVEADGNNPASPMKNNIEIGAAILSTSINGQPVTMLGGYGGRKISENIFIGGGGFGLANNTAVTINNQNRFLKFAYGGVILGYSEAPFDIFQYRLYTLIGGGTIDYDKYTFNNLLFVSELGISGEIKVVEHFRTALAIGYRSVHGTEVEKISDANLSNFFWSIHFKVVGF